MKYLLRFVLLVAVCFAVEAKRKNNVGAVKDGGDFEFVNEVKFPL